MVRGYHRDNTVSAKRKKASKARAQSGMLGDGDSREGERGEEHACMGNEDPLTQGKFGNVKFSDLPF